MFSFQHVLVVSSILLLLTVVTSKASGRLGVSAPISRKRKYPLEFVRTQGFRSDLMELPIPPDSASVGRPIVELGLPKGTLVVLIGRGDEFMIPSGSTLIERGDSMLVLADKESLQETRRILEVRRAEGETGP